MSYVMLTFESNWADEMDVEGFLVTTKEYWEKSKAKLLELGECYLNVGTNESVTWDSGEELVDDIEVKEIADEEAMMLKKLFKGHFYYGDKTQVIAGFGYTGFLDNIGEGSGW